MDYQKIPQEINNMVGDNVKLLAQLFPAAVKDGQVDFEALKEELGQFEEVGKEKYELTWAGKQGAKKLAQEDVYNRTLKYIEADSKNPDTTENLYIEGDNLEVLKLLRQNYHGAIKMIYIDPPYNTDGDFVYNDKFKMGVRESDIAEGTRGDEGNPLQKSSKSSNRYHANWLNMIYPRLKIAKDLLTDDGVLFISIDDNEISSLLSLLEEIFNAENIKPLCVKMSEASGLKMGAVKKMGTIPKLKEYVVVVKKDGLNNFKFENIKKESWDTEYNIFLENFSIENKRMLDEFVENDNITESSINALDEIASNVKWISISEKLKEFSFNNEEKEKWLYDNAYRICQCATSTSVLALAEEKKKTCNKELFFVMSKSKENIYFVRGNYSTESKKPRIQLIFAEDNLSQHPGDIWVDIKTTGLDNEGNVPFKNGKKPAKLLQRLISSINNNSKESFYSLDFFSGSASTAEAIMKHNYENSDNRKFIMVQLQESLDDSYSQASGAAKNSIKQSIDFLDEIEKQHFVTEIGKERIRRAGEKIRGEIEAANAQLKLGEEPKQVPDIGFKVFRTADTNIKWNLVNTIGQLTTEEMTHTPDLADFTSGAKDIDVVYEIMLRQKDVPLSATLETLIDIGNRTYLYGSAYLVCLETEITEALIDKLAALDPLPIKFVFRDSAFKDDINLKDETFRRLKNLIERNAGNKKTTYTVEFI